MKHDEEKPMMQLVPLDAVLDVARVLTFGAKKYSPESWKTLEDGVQRYIGALLRHLEAFQRGEVNDPESGLPHTAHIATNALFISSLTNKKK